MSESYGKLFKDGLWENNVVFSQMLALCPTMAVTTSGTNGLGMGLATTAVLVVSNILVSMIRHTVSSQVRIPVFVVLIATLVTVATHYLSVSAHLLSGAAMLGAFFIATDYVTSPNTGSGQIAFGLGIGFLTWVIRTYGGYPEGMAFAVLLMNALTPVIDRFAKPRILGRDRKGKALDIPESKGA